MPLPNEYYGKVKLKELIETFDYAMDNATPPPQDLPIASTTQLGVVALASVIEPDNEMVATSNLVSEAIKYIIDPTLPSDVAFPEGRTEYKVDSNSEEYEEWEDWIATVSGVLPPSGLIFDISTIYIEGSDPIQKVNIYYNSNEDRFTPIMTVHRLLKVGDTDPERIELPTITKSGSPTSNNYAVKGTIYVDTSTGNRYKASSTSSSLLTNTWVRIKDMDTRSFILEKGSTWIRNYPHGSGIDIPTFNLNSDTFTINFSPAFTKIPSANISSTILNRTVGYNEVFITSLSATQATVVLVQSTTIGITFNNCVGGAQIFGMFSCEV